MLYPYTIEPKLTTAIWGGDALVTRFGKKGDAKATYGESWECWDANRIANGPLAGKSIAELRADLGAALLGDLDAKRLFPLLTKIIDARGALSVQVHPDDAYAQRVEHQDYGKTECWYVLDAVPGAELVLGFEHTTSRAEFERCVADGSLGDILHRVPVKANDAFYIPAGRLHAISAGIIIFEAQQASDLTYRIFDWNRVGADGKPRELHVQKAGDVLDFEATHDAPVRELAYTHNGLERVALIAGSYFIVERLTVRESARLQTEGRPLILMTLNSNALLRCADGETALAPYTTALIPAAAGEVEVCATGSANLMFVSPAREEALRERLRQAGIEAGCTDAFLRQFQPLART